MFINDGKNVEIVSLGEATVVWSGDYVPYQRAMEDVRENQPGDPSDPECPFANDLHALVALALDLENWSELGFYTAVGSPLDILHGVDGFFEFRGNVVTIDGTLDPDKILSKAGFVVNFNWSKPEIEHCAGSIAQALT